MVYAPKRVEAIRINAAAHLKAAAALETQVKDAYFQDRLQLIRKRISNVDTFFLQTLAQESRTPEQESASLADAERVLYIASLQIELIQDTVAKSSTNAAAAGR